MNFCFAKLLFAASGQLWTFWWECMACFIDAGTISQLWSHTYTVHTVHQLVLSIECLRYKHPPSPFCIQSIPDLKHDAIALMEEELETPDPSAEHVEGEVDFALGPAVAVPRAEKLGNCLRSMVLVQEESVVTWRHKYIQ